MAGKTKSEGVDPTWPQAPDDSHVLTEFTADRQGSLSPYGDLEFPIEPGKLPYVHPTTVINR